METAVKRDLASADLWQESLERSRERRRAVADTVHQRSHQRSAAAPARPSSRRRRGAEHGLVKLHPAELRRPIELHPPEPRQRVASTRPATLVLEPRTYWRRRLLFLLWSVGVVALAATGVLRVLGGSRAGDLALSPGAVVADVQQATIAGSAVIASNTQGPRIAPAPAKRAPASKRAPAALIDTGPYVDPIAGAKVIPERIDQGVDYGGSGPLTAIGDGKITYLGLINTGWPGAFIEYRLSNGPDAGRYVYYAEGITPVRGLHKGERIIAGEKIASLIPNSSSGIEIGWGAGANTLTWARKTGHWDYSDDDGSVPSASGKNFSALIVALGGRGGKIEG